MPLEGSAQPQFPANASFEKRAAMLTMAQEFLRSGDPDSDEITSFSNGRVVLRGEMDHGTVVQTASRRR